MSLQVKFAPVVNSAKANIVVNSERNVIHGYGTFLLDLAGAVQVVSTDARLALASQEHIRYILAVAREVVSRVASGVLVLGSTF